MRSWYQSSRNRNGGVSIINGTKAHEEAGIKEGDDELSIIYTEFAAMNTYQIQKCKKEISNLKNEIAELKNIISNLNA